MKRSIVAAGIFVLAVAVLRRFGPALGKRAMTKCEEMFGRMPEDFPPERTMRGIEGIGEPGAMPGRPHPVGPPRGGSRSSATPRR